MSAWTVIEHEEVGSGGVVSIEFTSIPATYTDLVILYSGRGETQTDGLLNVSFNGVTTNRSHRVLTGNGSTATSASSASVIQPVDNPSDWTASTFSSVFIYIPNYTSSNNKSISIDSVTENDSSVSLQRLVAGLWSSSDAITSIKLAALSGDIAQYSNATLYGVLKGSSGGVTVS